MVHTFGPLVIDEACQRVVLHGRDVRLRPLDMRVLVHLAHRPDRTLGRRALADAVWGPDSMVDARSVDACVKRIRRALDGAGHAIVTVRRVGYRLDPQRLS